MLPLQGGKTLQNKTEKKEKKQHKSVKTQQNILQRCLDLRLNFCFGSSSS
jgi:hypothetical protein